MVKELAHYIFRRICKDKELLRRAQPMNSYGLYIRPRDIQRYISDYTNYGIDYTGDDNICADDATEHYLEDFLEPHTERYWDEPEGKED